MITLQPINEMNFMEAAALKVTDEQRYFVAPAPMILAMTYAYRDQRAICWGIYENQDIVGLAMVHDMDEEPACYHLCEFMIDAAYQNRGIGYKALELVLNCCRSERKYNTVEVCVKKADSVAVHLYEKAGFRDSGYQDPDLPGSLCMVYNLSGIQVKPTGIEDLANVQRLWATPEVMFFVGFPEGLQETLESLEKNWLPWVNNLPKRCHYSIYADDIGYCGESFYEVDETGLACMDIKLLPEARGRGIAFVGLSYALQEAFSKGNADRAYVDPNPENIKAIRLYERLGFLPTDRPNHLEEPDCPYIYMELARSDWENN